MTSISPISKLKNLSTSPHGGWLSQLITLLSACFGEYFPFLHVTNCLETNLLDSSQLNLQVLPLQLAITSSDNLSFERTSPHGVDVFSVDAVDAAVVVVELGGAKEIPAPSAGCCGAFVVEVAFVEAFVVVGPVPPVHSTRTLLMTPSGLVLTFGLHLPGVPIFVLQTILPVFRIPECSICAVGSLHLTLQTFS